MPRGGKRANAGRRPGTGRFGERVRTMSVPLSLVGEVSALCARYQQDAAPIRVDARAPLTSAIKTPEAGHVSVAGRVDALTLLNTLAAQQIRPSVVMLDPDYRVRKEKGRAAYLSETLPLIEAAGRVSDHVFVWGYQESLGRLMDLWSPNLKLESWLTWFYPNIAARSKGWRPSQQGCLHLRKKSAQMYPEHFYDPSLLPHARRNKLEFKMGPLSVIKAGHPHGSVCRNEQVGFTGGQKPEAVIEQLLMMTTKEGDLIVDPTAGSGTTAVVAAKMGRAAIISDRSADALKKCRVRITRNKIPID